MPDHIEISDVDAEIAEIRAKTTLSGEQMGQRLEPLYKRKSDILAGRPVVGRSEQSVDQKIQAVRDDVKLTAEQKGEKLELLYREKVSLEKAKESEPPADPEAVSREVQSELRNSWGSQYEPKMNGIAEVVLDVFGGEEQFKSFSEKLALGRDEQISAMHQLADLCAAPIENKMSLEEADDIVDERLRSMWGSRAVETVAVAQKCARAAFGDLERANKYFVDRGYGGNPEKRIEMWVLLSRIGRNIKTETLTQQEEREAA
jgi:hypothetical protein